MAPRVPLPLVALISVALVGTAMAMAFSSVALAGDGSYYLVRILDTERVFGPELRVFGNVVRQAPVLIAVRAGMVDTHVLTVIFGLGLFLVPVAAWCLAIYWARAEGRVFVAVSMIAGLCAGTTWFFAISESVIAVPLTVLIAVLLWQSGDWSRTNLLVATSASAILVATYETSLLSSSVFVVWASLRARRATTRIDRTGALVVAVLSGVSVVTAVGGVLLGQERTPDHVQSLLYFVVSLSPWPLYVGLLAIAAIVAALGDAFDRRLRIPLLTLGVVGAAIAAAGLAPTPAGSFAARGGAPIAAILLQLLLLGLWFRAKPRRVPQTKSSEPCHGRSVLLIPVVFVAALAFANARALQQWSASLEVFRAEVRRAETIKAVDSAVPSNRRQVVWGWTSTSLSLIVRESPSAGVLVDRDPSYVPFPPEEAREQLPARYVWLR